MAADTFDALQERIQQLFQSGEYAAALSLAEEEAPAFPEYTHLTNYWRLVLAARLGDAATALRALDQALESGFWYGEKLLRSNSSLKTLQGQLEFEQRVEANRRLQQADQLARYPMLVLRDPQRCETGGPSCATMLALHANAATLHDSLAFWQPAARQGWLVGALQSSQAIWKGAYVWDDLQQAGALVQQEFDTLRQKYPVDPERVVLAGHGSGAEAAAFLALESAIPASGMLLVAPSGTMMGNLESWVEPLNAEHPGLRAYILAGEEDLRVEIEGLQEFAALLERAGVPCELEIVPHAGSDYLPEYEPALLRALEFLAPE